MRTRKQSSRVTLQGVGSGTANAEGNGINQATRSTATGVQTRRSARNGSCREETASTRKSTKRNHTESTEADSLEPVQGIRKSKRLARRTIAECPTNPPEQIIAGDALVATDGAKSGDDEGDNDNGDSTARRVRFSHKIVSDVWYFRAECASEDDDSIMAGNDDDDEGVEDTDSDDDGGDSDDGYDYDSDDSEERRPSSWSDSEPAPKAALVRLFQSHAARAPGLFMGQRLTGSEE